MKTDQPTAAQKRWREAVRELGSVISGDPAVIHHPAGRKAKHNKVEIGHWWVIPLTDEEHKALHRGVLEWSVVGWFEGCDTRKEFEKRAFEAVLGGAHWAGVERPPIEAVLAIQDYHR